MLYETASVTTGLFYNFIFVKMKEPNKLLKLKLKLNLFEVNINCAQPVDKSKQGGIRISVDGSRSRGPRFGSQSGNALSSKYLSSEHNP